MLVRAKEDLFHIGFRQLGDVFEWHPSEEVPELPETMEEVDPDTCRPRTRNPQEVTFSEFHKASAIGTGKRADQLPTPRPVK